MERKIAATYIFPVNQPPIKNGIVVCNEDGKIIELIDNKGVLNEESGLEYYSGIIVPGFVNSHCHLELSNFEGKIEEKKGIGDFIGKINLLRNESDKDLKKLMQIADRKMWKAGISAVGDISNSTLSIHTKLKSQIRYHTFVESFGFHPSRADKSFHIANSVLYDFLNNNQHASIVPHSPYSVSEPLFEKIKSYAVENKSIISIHNQESIGESEFYKSGTGPIAKHMEDNLEIDISHWKPTGESSLSSVLKYLPAENQLLLVHNTFTEKEDLEKIKENRSLDNTFFILCPNSNLFIENHLPPISLFRDYNLNICIGTDSLASNHRLSILSEMITIQENFEEVTLDELVKWATYSGAKALNINETYGSIEIGKNPGINLISGIDFSKMKLTKTSKVKRLV